LYLLHHVLFVVYEHKVPHQAQVALVPALLVLWLVALFSTVSWFLRSRSLRLREIQASLADLAEQVRQLVENQQADRPKQAGQPGPESESETKRD
jgi:non-ribosomal peptide synthetase component E (peptide arylation enzyme)